MPKFKKADDNENLVYRHTMGELELGIWPVLFGMRVRAGYIGDPCALLDWCAGNDQRLLNWCFSAAKNILENQGDFNGIPRCSSKKPVNLDSVFVSELTRLFQGRLEVEQLPSISSLRELCFGENDPGNLFETV